MTFTFHSESLIDVWAAGAHHIVTKPMEGLMIVLSAGTGWTPSSANLRKLDDKARTFGFETPSSVAEMLLPQTCMKAGFTALESIQRGTSLLGAGRRRGLTYSNWAHTYFERMIGSWCDKAGRIETFRDNKLALVIAKLNAWPNRPKAALYIHTALDHEGFRTRGGPCLQYIQFRVHGTRELEIIGVYRAHDYGNKALGNLVGLDRVGRFVASHTGHSLSGVSVVSLHPMREQITKLGQFIENVRQG